jgi:hypothetical protein
MRHLLLLLALAGATTLAADAPKPNALTPKEIADGWIMLFDGETPFGWKAEGDVTVSNGTIAVGGAKDGTLTSTTSFGPGVLRITYHVRGNQPAVLTWRGPPKFVTGRSESSDTTEEVTGEGQQLSPIKFHGVANAKWVLRAVAFRPTGLKSIFNGKDLSGWKVFAGDANRAKSKFVVTPEGWLNVTNGPGDLQTEGQWADFVFQGECISNGKHLNSGIFFRCLPNQYQNGYEMQVRNQWEGDNRGKPVDFGTGAIYRRQPARKVMATDGEWFTMTLVAHGNHFATWVNGYQVTDWTDERPENANARNGRKLGAGHLSIQGHDPTTNLSFRNLRVADLN